MTADIDLQARSDGLANTSTLHAPENEKTKAWRGLVQARVYV